MVNIAINMLNFSFALGVYHLAWVEILEPKIRDHLPLGGGRYFFHAADQFDEGVLLLLACPVVAL